MAVDSQVSCELKEYTCILVDSLTCYSDVGIIRDLMGRYDVEVGFRTGAVALAADYNRISFSDCEDGLVSWIAKSLVKSPLEWAVSKIKYPFAAKIDPAAVRYVHVDVAKVILHSTFLHFTKDPYSQKLLAVLCPETVNPPQTVLKKEMSLGFISRKSAKNFTRN